MAKSKKPRKAYRPKVSNEIDFLNQFNRKHDSFTTIDNLISQIELGGKLNYMQGVGFVTMNELGEEVIVVDELRDWISEWATIAKAANVINYDDSGLVKLRNKLHYESPLTKRDVESAQAVINVQRDLYTKLAKTNEGRAIIRVAIEPRQTREAIKHLLGARENEQ